jgi:NADH:ubiquinone oxidoreductase subunit H
MKKHIIGCILILQITGCTVFNNIFMGPYDTNEYLLVTKVRTTAQTVMYRNILLGALQVASAIY